MERTVSLNTTFPVVVRASDMRIYPMRSVQYLIIETMTVHDRVEKGDRKGREEGERVKSTEHD